MAIFLTEQIAEGIRAKVRAVESRTAAELVPVIALQSDGYRFIPALYAGCLALILPFPFVAFNLAWPVAALDMFTVQLLVAVLGAILLQILPGVRVRLVPKRIRHRRAALVAHEQFLAQRVHMAEGHMGVMLFVSVAEHYVEVLADEGIAAKVDPSEWQKAVDDFVTEVKQGRVAEGFEAALDDIGKVLAEKAPAEGKNSDDLPNRLVVLS